MKIFLRIKNIFKRKREYYVFVIFYILLNFKKIGNI